MSHPVKASPEASAVPAAPATGPRRMVPLFWRVFLGNAVALVVATSALTFGPITVSHPVDATEVGVILVWLLLLLALNAWLIGSALRPLRELADAMHSVDAPESSDLVPVRRNDEVGEVAAAFNHMLHRLTRERESAARASLSAQEDERRRVSRELHDEVGQSLTVLLLRLKAIADAAPPELRDPVGDLQAATRSVLEDVRSISARLRPGVLEDLGLSSALQALARDIRTTAGLDVVVEVAADLDLAPEEELVVYRVAQEALTNVVRHAEARRVALCLRHDGSHVILEVRDDGNGAPGTAGSGITGMRERARLVRGRLHTQARPGHGTCLTLHIPDAARPREGR